MCPRTRRLTSAYRTYTNAVDVWTTVLETRHACKRIEGWRAGPTKSSRAAMPDASLFSRTRERCACVLLLVLAGRAALLYGTALFWSPRVSRLLLRPLPDASLRRVHRLAAPARIGSAKTPLSEAYASEPGVFAIELDSHHSCEYRVTIC